MSASSHDGDAPAVKSSTGGWVILLIPIVTISLAAVIFWLGFTNRHPHDSVPASSPSAAQQGRAAQGTATAPVETMRPMSVKVWVTPHKEGFSKPVEPPDDHGNWTYCRSLTPTVDGFNVQVRDRRFHDEDAAHWSAVGTPDNASKIIGNAERYQSTEEQGFFMRVWFVSQGEACT